MCGKTWSNDLFHETRHKMCWLERSLARGKKHWQVTLIINITTNVIEKPVVHVIPMQMIIIILFYLHDYNTQGNV